MNKDAIDLAKQLATDFVDIQFLPALTTEAFNTAISKKKLEFYIRVLKAYDDAIPAIERCRQRLLLLQEEAIKLSDEETKQN
jgi:hypothetical protein